MSIDQATGVVCAGNMRYGVPELSMRDINAPITIELVSKAFPEAVRAAGADVLLVQEVGRMQMPAVARASGLMHMAFGHSWNGAARTTLA